MKWGCALIIYNNNQGHRRTTAVTGGDGKGQNGDRRHEDDVGWDESMSSRLSSRSHSSSGKVGAADVDVG